MIKKVLLFVIIVLMVVAALLFGFEPPEAEKITWGVNFSQKHAKDLGLNWQETYLALLDDLKTKNIKLLTHWDLLESAKDQYHFDDLDWQVAETEKRDAKIILVIGMKTGRWPECHIPSWAQNLTKGEQQKEILELVENIVLRYRDSRAIKTWQAENEPFFPFGVCPWSDKGFVKKEIELIKSLDGQERRVLVTDSGELSSWIRPAKLGDIVGTTMYRRVWSKELKAYITFPLPPTFYWLKAKFIERVFGKDVIVVELQAEPWGQKLLYGSPLEEQEKTMNLKQFRKNIEFAKKTGFDEFYLWGAEWWHWLKEKQNHPEIWEEAKKIISNQ